MTKFLTIAGIFGFFGVILGAFGAHGFEERLMANGQLDNWDTATLYLFVHVLALFVLSNFQGGYSSRTLNWIGWFWTAGIFIFSGSLYLLALTNLSKLGMVTPLGGVCFLAGWGALAKLGFRKMKSIEGT